VQRLRELGWIEGGTVAIEYRWSEARPERYAEIAAEFVRLGVNVIVTNAFAVSALEQATAVIPIVFVLAPDPLGAGMVKSLARPGGNVTGLSVQAADVAGKRLELLGKVVPGLRRLAVLFNADFSQNVLEADGVQAAARTLGLEVVRLEIRRTEDIQPAFSALNPRADALFVVGDALVAANLTRIITFALTARLPTSFNTRDFVQAGGLMSYGPDFSAIFRRAAEYVDKILRGANPGDIPVEQPTKFDLVVNLTTAKALGLEVPAQILALADEVIE
jgi:putative ABC transport system substrate-binding protein